MIELGVVTGIFVLIVGLIWFIVKIVRNSAEAEVDADQQRRRASVYKMLSERKRTKDMAEARRNAARRREPRG